ncbi:hypothetical protein CYMTET_23494 [Cymbomonas tetramitiformis]|uniref:Uncharacterized protein n=1 Tax=Cymbomonas tetramitiformis TaxID=36881 RepID=A0AAE0L153_9CHLO|nr:hypothetical protein CYMTET_23494 [Cymbomonas tetramitiformis]
METDSAADRDGRRALVDLIKGLFSDHREQRLVRENRAADWTPTAATRKAQLWENLDPVFCVAVKVNCPRLQDLHAVSIAELSDLVASIYVSWEQYAGGTPGTAAAVGVPGDDKTDRDDILEKLLSRLDKIEAFIKTQRMGGAPAILTKRNRKGLDGFRVGVGQDPRVGFDPGAKKASPKCPRCPTAGDGHRYHAWADCPLGGKRHPARSTMAYCQPVEECTTKVLLTLALSHVYQWAADSGKDAFAAAVEQHDAPAVAKAGEASGGADISGYGFAVMESDDSEDDEMDVQEELRQLRSQIGKAVTFGQASVPRASSLSFAATEEFPGGVDLVPVRRTVPHAVPSVSLGAPISAVKFSLETAEELSVELEAKSELSQLDVLFMDSEEEESPPRFMRNHSWEHLVVLRRCLLQQVVAVQQRQRLVVIGTPSGMVV